MKTLKVMGLALALALTACSTYSVNRYSPSTDNILALKSLKGRTAKTGIFNSSQPDQKEIGCRGVGPIKTPDGESFANYIRKAFTDEMKLAEIYDENSPVTLTGTLTHIDFSSTNGAWDMSLEVMSSNGSSMKVDEVYKFTSSWYGETACNQTAQAFVPAVQDLVNKVVKSPEFARLLKK